MQLDFQTRTFLNGPSGHRLDPEARVLFVNRILESKKDDFTRGDGSLRAYLSRYLAGEAAAAARDSTYRIEYLGFDWALNDAR